MFSALKNIKPHIFFIYCGIFFFILLNIVTAPLQAPDEFNHFYRAYQIAEGQFLPNKVDNRLGGEIPNCIKEFICPFDNAATQIQYTLTKKEVLNGFKIPFNKDKSVFTDFPNTSYYSPISYAPQALALFITKQLKCSVGAMYYVGRLFIILVWLISMFFVIKMVPIYKWLFTLICLLPMNLYVTNSFSADTMSNIPSFLFMALVLKYTFSEKQFNYKNLLLLILIISLVALAKVVYVGSVLAFLIIPIKNFKTKNQYYLFTVILFLVAFLVTNYWSGQIMSKYTPYVNYNPQHRNWICLTNHSNYYLQKEYILTHGFYFFKVIFHSIFDHPYNSLVGYIGIFGNSDIPLPTWLLWISYALIIFIALFENNNFKVNLWQKVVLFSAPFCAFVLLLLSQHLTWDAVGEGVVDLVQGRYLIPIFPLMFFVFGNHKLKYNVNYSVLIVGLLFILYSVSAYKIINRYYIGNAKSKFEFTSNLEAGNQNGFFTTSNSESFLEGGYSKTNVEARSGISSLRLDEQSPFGLTYRFNNLNYGDFINISVWTKGESTQLVFTVDGKNCKKIYAPTNTARYYDKNGWAYLSISFLMQDTCKNASAAFYVWNPTKTRTYVDDLSFSIKKF